MPRLETIRKLLRNQQAEIADMNRRLPVYKYLGFCGTNIETARILGGDVWNTDEPSRKGEIGHYVAVIKHKGSKSGYITDVTEKNPIVDEVESVYDKQEIARKLQDAYGVDGWYKTSLGEK